MNPTRLAGRRRVVPGGTGAGGLTGCDTTGPVGVVIGVGGMLGTLGVTTGVVCWGAVAQALSRAASVAAANREGFITSFVPANIHGRYCSKARLWPPPRAIA